MADVREKMKREPLQSKRVILCEGTDEYDLLMWLRDDKKWIPEDVEILNAKGRDNLPTRLKDLRYESGGSDVQLVCVVLDAEERQGLDEALINDLKAQANAAKLQLMIEELPNSTDTGSMETLVRNGCDANTQAYQCADQWEQCLSKVDDARTQAQKDKAWAHEWLAGQGKIYSRIGYAFTDHASVRANLSHLQTRFEAILNRVMSEALI